MSGPGRGAGPLPKRPRSTAHDIERYAALFAERTKVMKSSAMRDLMALTERDDVISLAGGLPDTSTFPPDSLRLADEHGRGRVVRAGAAVRPDGGTRRWSSAASLEVMRAEGMEVDRRRAAGHDRRPAGDRPRVQDAASIPATWSSPRRPRTRARCPTFCAYQADVVQVTMDRDGMRVDELEADPRRARALGPPPEVHLHRPELPQPSRRDDVAGAPRASSCGSPASASCWCSRTTRTGCCATRATPLPTLRSLDDEFVIYASTFSKILSPGRPAGLGLRSGAGAQQDEHRQAGIGPVLVLDLPVLRRARTSTPGRGRTTCAR